MCVVRLWGYMVSASARQQRYEDERTVTYCDLMARCWVLHSQCDASPTKE